MNDCRVKRLLTIVVLAVGWYGAGAWAQAAGAGAQSTAAGGGADTAAELRSRVVSTARTYLGVPYVYGAMSPRAFDCSGFVSYVFRQAATLTVPRSARDYTSVGTPINLRTVLPGDVLVFDTVGGRPSHVGIYIGDDRFIHAASAGIQTGVIISSVYDRYWQPRMISVRRILPATSAVAAASVASAPPASPPSGTAAAANPAPAAVSAPVTPAVPPAVATAPPASSTVPSAAAAATATAAAAASTVPPAAAASPADNGGQAAITAAASLAAAEPVIAEIGFEIPAERTTYADPIPTSMGTELAFTVSNQSGKAGRFVIIFYKLEQDLGQSRELHRELVDLAAGASYTLPAYRFGEAGRYRLIVKDNWNNQLLERSFRVLE